MFLFPAIDLCQGRVVRLHQGDYQQQTCYGLDPVAQAQAYERAGATWVHVVDLDGARTGHIAHLDVIKSICARTRLKVQVGGGVRSEETIHQLIDAGVVRVVLGTAALRNWSWFESLVTSYVQCLVLGLDARGGMAAVSGWQEQTKTMAIDLARTVSAWPLAAIVFTDIDTDGTMGGPSIASTRQIAEATRVPVVASGGVGTLDDLRALRKLPVQGAIVGKALYEEAFTISRALAVLEGDE